MPNYRVGVSLDLRGNYGKGLTGAAAQTDRFRGVVARTAGSATGDLRRTSAAAVGVGDAVGRTARRSTSGLQRIAGASGSAAGAMDRVAGASRRVGTAARRMADTTSAALGRTRRQVNNLIGRFRVLERTTGRAGGGALAGGIGRLAGYAGGGFAVARAGQQAAAMDTLVLRLSRESKRSTEDITGLRDRAYEIGADRGVHASELMQAVVAAQGAGGVRIEGEDLESLAVIMQRAGVGGAEAGNIWARIDELPGETRENVATLAMQADAGELQFRDVIGQITRLVSSVRSWATDETAVAQMGAMMNVARAGSGSIDEGSAAMDTLTREAVMRAEQIRKVFGVDVLSAAPGREGFLREDFFSGAIMEIADSARAWGGEARLLEAFGADALRAMKSLLTEEGAKKGRESLAIRGGWLELEADADVIAEGIEARGIAMVQKLEGQLTSLITGPMQSTFTLMQAYQTELMVGAAGAVAAMNLLSRYRLRRAMTEGFAARTAATSTVATMRVGTLIVGSMPGGVPRTAPGTILGPDGKPVPRGQSAPPKGSSGGHGVRPGRPGRLAGWSRTLGRAGRGIPYAGAGIAALSLLPAVASGDTRSVVQSTAGLAGSLGLAKLGAAIGTAIAPGIGTAIGGLAGSLIGWFAGDQAAAKLDPDTWRPRVDVELDENGRPKQSVRGRVRERGLVARTAGVEREPGKEDVDTEDVDGQPRSVRGRVRRNDLVARTAGVEREPDEEDVDTEDVDGQPRSVRGRVRRNELSVRGTVPELQPARATYDHSDHSDRRSTVNITPGAITVQAAEDPEATAEAVADRVMEITERERGRRDRRIRDAALEDPDPDPVL